jgi:hypothetical protein
MVRTSAMERVRIGLIGAGIIGATHSIGDPDAFP